MISRLFRRSSLVLGLSFAAAAAGPRALPAQEESSGGLAALELPTGARPLGMGRAYASVGGDIQGLFFNPAGLAGRDSLGLTFSRYQGASRLDLNGNFGAVSVPVFGGVATAAINYEDLGEIEVTGSSSELLATRDLRNLLLVGSYALELLPSVAVGASIKYLSSDLGVADGTGVAFDAGVQVKPLPSLPFSLGLAALNVGPDVTFEVDDPVVEGDAGEGDRLPSRIRYGAAADVGRLAEPTSPYGVTLAADVEHDMRELGDVSVFGGVAVDYQDVVVLRGGALRLDNAFGGDAATGASVGAGVHWRNLRIDIARELGVNEVGDETHFSLGADF